jgi:17beta-estradiol 17-dehydrogenase / very-long-chain 3-oxoacyl-CoA reductase
MDFLNKIPKPVLAGFAGLGLLVISSKILSYIRLLLSLFVLSGKNVSSFPSLTLN